MAITASGKTYGAMTYEAVHQIDLMEGSTVLATQTREIDYDQMDRTVNTTWTFNLAATIPPGTHNLYLHARSKRYSANMTSDSGTFTVTVYEDPPVNSAQGVQTNTVIPTTVEAGSTFAYEVVMRNNGTSTWTTGGVNPYFLGSQNWADNRTWGTHRIALPYDVTPGNQVAIRGTMTAPIAAGPQNFQWQMVRENVAWFGDLTPNAVINVVQTKPNVGFTGPSVANCTTSNNSCVVTFSGNGSAVSGFGMSSLELYEGATRFGLGTNTVSGNVTLTGIGDHTVELRGRDTRGVQNSAYMTFSVRGAPTASLSSPANNVVYQMVSGLTYPVTIVGTSGATAPASLTQVTLTDTLVGVRTDSFAVSGGSFSLPLNLAPGNHAIQLTAVDSFQKSTSSNVLNITVKAPVPTISMSAMTGPTSKVTSSGSAVFRFTGSASTPSGTLKRIDLVDLSDKVWSSVALSGAPIGTFDQDVTLPVGNYVLRFKAVNSFDAYAYSGTANVAVTPDEAPIAVDMPFMNNPVAGTLPGALSVSPNGTASYSMALAVPPGTAGMAPQLSLNYSSDSGNGLLGLGWSLGGMTHIHRCGKTIAQDGVNGRISFNSGDRLCLDGQRLVLANTALTDASYWADGAEYRTEIDSFRRITLFNKPEGMTFKVESKDGRVTTYGGGSATVQAVVSPVASGTEAPQPNLASKQGAQSWAIARVVDRMGNYITYEYAQDMSSGEHIPKYIRYGGAGKSSHAAVAFEPEGRADAWKRYIDETRNDLRQRIRTIRTYVGSNLDGAMATGDSRRVHEYKLVYDASPTSGRSLLSSVQACASSPSDGSDTCLPETTFNWGKPAPGKTPGFVSRGFWPGAPIMTTYRPDGITGILVGAIHPEYFAFSDFDRDGFADVLEKRVTSMSGSAESYNPLPAGTKYAQYRYFRNTGNGFAEYTYGLNTGEQFVVMDTGDFDGDGALDLLVYTNRMQICLSPLGKPGNLGAPGSRITFACDPNRPAVGGGGGTAVPYVADVFGDGRAAHFASTGYTVTRCVQGSCEVMSDPPDVLGSYNPDDNSYHSYTSFSQMVDFSGVGRPYDVRWSRMYASKYVRDGGEVIEYPTPQWFNTKPIISIYGAGFDDNPVSSYGYPYDFRKASMVPMQLAYRFDSPAEGGLLTADFNGSGYNSLAFGYLQFAYPNGVRAYDKAEMTLCLSTGRALDCGVRRKYSGADYRVVRTVGNFVGDGAPAILVEKMSYPAGVQPAPTGDLEVCRVMGDDTTNGSGANDSNMTCTPWSGLNMAVGPYRNVGGTTFYFMDLLGTGRPQVVQYHSGYVANNQWVEDGRWEVFEPIDVAADGEALDRIVKVTNGNGASSSVEYADALPNGLVPELTDSTLAYPVQPARSPGKLVRRLRTANGVSPDRTMRYVYRDAATDVAGRGALGFAKVDMIDEQTGISTSTTYRQQWPFTGHVAQVAVTSGSVVLSNTTNDVRSADIVQGNGARSKFVYVADSTTTRTDLDGTPLGSVQTHNEFSADGWANLTQQVVTASGAGKIFTTTVNNTFKPADAGRWIFGLVDTSATTRTSAAGSLTRTVKHTYDDNTGLAVSDIVEPGVEKYQVTTTYDRSNNAFGVVGLVTQRWIDPLTKLEVKRETVTEYDANGRFALKLTKKVATGNEHVESRTYDSGSGAVLSLTDRNSFKTTYTVDGFGRVQKELRNDNNETRAYLKTCQTGCQPGAAMVRIVESYNGNNRIGVPKVEFSDSVGHVLRSQTWNIDGSVIFAEQEYDSLGRQSHTYHPRDPAKKLYLASRTEYDILNRVTKLATVDEGGVERGTNTTYNGFSITRTNARGYSRTETRDALGQMEWVRDANNKDTKFEYDPFGNLASTTDPNGNVIRVASDLWGRKERLNDPDLGEIQYTVDPVGRVREQFTARQGAGKKTRMEYDVLDRMTVRFEPSISASEPGLESHWVYDTAAYGKGQLAEAFTGTETNKDYYRSHTYENVLGRPKQTMQTIGSSVYRSEQGYDVYGRLETISHRRDNNAPKQFSMRYSSAGYLRKVLRGTQLLWEVQSLDPSQRPTKILLGNGLVQTRDFDANSGRLTGASLQFGTVPRMTEGYEYDEIGSIKTRNQYWDVGGFHETFGYDSLNRIERSTIGAVNQAFKYDAAGNMTEKNGAVYTYQGQGPGKPQPHAVQSITGLGSYAYDANGNMRSTPTGGITWTAFDMPDRITKATASGTTWASFVYGTEHQRTRQMRSDGSEVNYAGAQEVEIKNGQATIKTYWPNGIGVEIDRPGVATTELNWSHVDWLGSPVALSDEAGTLREKMSYDAWGRRRKLDGSAANDTLDGVAGVVDNKGFTGHEMLDQLDLVHMNGRIYDPRISRFASADPNITDPMEGQNYNRYSYVLNNPTNLTDPSGFDPCPNTTNDCDKPTRHEVTGSNLKQQQDTFNLTVTFIRPPESGPKTSNGGGQANVKNNPPAGSNSASNSLTEIAGKRDSKESTAGTTNSIQSVTVKGHSNSVESSPQPQNLVYDSVSGGHGQSDWKIKWRLAKPSKKGGYIVQEIKIDGTPGYHYWEAWKVDVGAQVTTFNAYSSYDDQFKAPSGTTIEGRARFYEGLQLPRAFLPGFAPPSGSLPSTYTDQKIPTKNATESVDRTWTAPI